MAEWNVQIVTASAAKDATIRMSKNERPVAGRSAAASRPTSIASAGPSLIDWARCVRDGAVQTGLERVDWLVAQALDADPASSPGHGSHK